MLRFDPPTAPSTSSNPAAPHAAAGLPLWPLACSVLACLLAAASLLAGLPLRMGWLQALSAHDLRGLLALALVLAGAAGTMPGAGPAARLLRLLASAALAVAAVAQLVDVATAPAAVAGPRVGLLAGLGLAVALPILAASLWPLPASRTDAAATAAQAALALLWAICAASLSALLPARLLLDGLPLDAGLSWQATGALMLLAAAATGRVYHQPVMRSYFRAREDRQIFSGYLAMLFGAIGLAALLVAGLLAVKVVESAKPVLHQGVRRQAMTLGELVTRVQAVADRAAASPDAGGTAPLTQPWLLDLRELLDPLGQVGVRALVPGQVGMTEGTFKDLQGPTLALQRVAGRDGVAGLDTSGVVLQMEWAVPQRPGVRVQVQLRPFRAEAQMPATEWLGVRADTMLCADAGSHQAQCLTRLRPEGLYMPLPPRADGLSWPIQRAWQGQDGVELVRDPALAAALVAYAPVAGTGLGVVQKMLVAPLVGRITDDVPAVLLTLLAVAAAGAWLLYRRAFPLLRELRYAKAQVEATLEHLPRGVLTLDAQDRVRSSNVTAQRLSGRSAAQLDGLPVQDLVAASPAGPAWQPVAGTSDAALDVAGAPAIPVEVQVDRFDFEGEPRSVVILRDLRRELAQRAELARWEHIFFHAEWGVAASTEDGQRVELANPAIARMLGYTLGELRQRPLIELFAPEVRADALAHIAQVQAQGHHRFESVHLRRDGGRVPVLIDATLVRKADGKTYRVVNVQDISEQQQAQQALQRSEARLLNAHRIAGLADWEWQAESDQVWLSEQGRAMMGLPAGHTGLLVGTDCLARVHPDERDAVFAAVKAALQGRQALAVDYRLLLDDGGERYVHQQGELVVGPPRRLIGVLQDITERKRTENELLQSRQRLRALSAREEKLIEEERRHMAREVHDELGQALTALKMALSLLGQRSGADTPQSAQVAHMVAMVDGTIDVVRHVASNLRPAALDFGLVAALEWLAEDFGLRWEIPCTVAIEGPDAELDDTQSTALFRIAQESLTNIARHANASRVDISISCTRAGLRLAVRDDGVGFDVQRALDARASFGLFGMRERALKVGARLRVDSSRGQGSVIEVELPLKDPQEP